LAGRRWAARLVARVEIARVLRIGDSPEIFLRIA